MPELTVAHIADTHLSAAGTKLDRESRLNAALAARYRCFRFCVEDAVQRGADLILHAGDVFDNPKPTPTEADLWARAMGPAIEAGIPTIIIRGNHDATPSVVDKDAIDLLGLMGGSFNLTVVDRPMVLELGSRDEFAGGIVREIEPAGTHHKVGLPTYLQIACFPWPNRSLLLASEEARGLSPVETNHLMSQKVCEVLEGLAAEAADDLDVPKILLAHLSVDAAQAGSEGRLMLLGSDWTVPLRVLEAGPWDAVMLGHIHKPQSWSRLTGEKMAYCGSPETMAFGEEDDQKGYLLWKIEADGGCGWESIPTPATRYLTLAPGEPLPEGLDPARTIVRVRGAAGEAIDNAAIAAAMAEAGIDDYRVETTPPETEERRGLGLSSTASLEEHLRAWCEREGGDAAERADALVEAAQAIAAEVKAGAA